MQGMQTKFMTEIEKTVTEHKYEAVKSGDYSNTGRIYIQRGFDTKVVIKYDFQNKYATLYILKAAKPGWAGDEIWRGLVYYDNSEQVRGFFDELEGVLS